MSPKHCVKSIQIGNYFAGKYGPEIIPYLDTFHAVKSKCISTAITEKRSYKHL